MQESENSPLQRETLHLLAEHIKISENEWKDTFLEAEIYPKKMQWWSFIEKLTLSVGIGMFLAGIIFFLAYNWSDLHKFVKLALPQSLLVLSLCILAFRKHLDFISQMVLLAIVMSIGICFTVFGQVYQTGADAYDLFLVWTLASIPFVLLSRFPSLWLLFLVLANTTLILWSKQVLSYREDEWVFLLLFLVNVFAFLVWEYGKRILQWQFKHNWFARITLFAACSYITIAVGIGIFELSNKPNFALSSFVIGGIFFASIMYFWYQFRDLLSVSFALVSLMVIVTCFILQAGDASVGTFFLAGFFCVGFSTYMAYLFIQTHKKWQQNP